MSGAGAEESAECGCAVARLLPAPEPDLLYDHHSSEEELEVNSASSRMSLSSRILCMLFPKMYVRDFHVEPDYDIDNFFVLASLRFGLVKEKHPFFWRKAQFIY